MQSRDHKIEDITKKQIIYSGGPPPGAASKALKAGRGSDPPLICCCIIVAAIPIIFYLGGAHEWWIIAMMAIFWSLTGLVIAIDIWRYLDKRPSKEAREHQKIKAKIAKLERWIRF